METMCKTDCCKECGKYKKECAGCVETNGHPCGGNCVAADCYLNGGEDEFQKLKAELIREINQFELPNLSIDDLHLLNGEYVNLPYLDIKGDTYELIKNNQVYFANQVEIPESDLCYGVACDKERIVISKYGCNGSDPELIVFKKRLM